MRTGLIHIVMLLLFAVSANATDFPLSRSISDKDIQWGPCPAFFPAGCQLAVLHGDPAKANADVYFKMPGKTSFPAHWHSSAERMVLVSGKMDVTYLGHPTTHLKAGMYAYGPAKAVHDGKCVSREACVLFIAFEQAVDAYEHTDKEIQSLLDR